MAIVDSLGDRMKSFEDIPRARLMTKTPVLGRIDGKAFHTFCRGLEKPYDQRFHRCMWETTRAICEKIQGVRIAYVQSDEISLLLMDNRSLDTAAWFNYEIQKMCSIAASWASAYFIANYSTLFAEDTDRMARLKNGPPIFDARFWNCPPHDVTNYFLWRQNDATRNSISMLAQANFSHKQLHGKNQSRMMDMLMELTPPINWDKCPPAQKRGVCIVREIFERNGAKRSQWVVDEKPPIFSKDRNYVEQYLSPPTEFNDAEKE